MYHSTYMTVITMIIIIIIINKSTDQLQGGPKKLHKVNDTIILQPYVIESCGFQQNVPKEILYMMKSVFEYSS